MPVEDEKKKKPLFDKDYQRWMIAAALLTALAALTQINLFGAAAVVFAFFVGLGIKEHGIHTKEVHVIEREIKQ